MYNVYVLRSITNGKRYVGLTSLIPEERLKQHNSGSNKWTKANGPFELIYVEDFSRKAEARKRELFFKTGAGREYLKNKLHKCACSSISAMERGGPAAICGGG